MYRKKYERTWVGTVNRNNQEFSIRRALEGIFTNAISNFRIVGHLKKGIASKTIELEMGITFWAILEWLIRIGVTATVTTQIFNDVYGWLLASLIAIIFVLVAIKDLQVSEEKITGYIKNPRSVSGLVVRDNA